ncbi:hypothetical protein CHCC15290_1842 [Bacillus licheniformis]|nr:hypothetical protein B4091_2391 [Bacillus licheniformis]TWN16574.1 hypothetical protein CHCC14564_1139 [Bacillus licheniformis LMG 17339]OLF86430.1 hypothetical protein B4089_3788 [Bacillus licheniformis]TWJ41043.1 hypothetical protein CHCC5025_1997 [Bacillus licheniformis]TWJ87272.1 hypothetical protein CHCC20496_1897 [Bacillus licheniformis]
MKWQGSAMRKGGGGRALMILSSSHSVITGIFHLFRRRMF